MSRLVAHRGLWWPDPSRQNTPEAFAAALGRDWGVELDIWHAAGDYLLGVGHDGDTLYDVSEAIPALQVGDGPVLWNIKNKGAEDGLKLVAARHPALWERGRRPGAAPPRRAP